MTAKSELARVRAIANVLPDVEEGTTFGYPAFKVKGRPFAWFPEKKEVEPGSMGVRMSLLERDHRIQANSDVYYYTTHYKEYPAVLARVWLLNDDALRGLLESGHEFMVTKARQRKQSRR